MNRILVKEECSRYIAFYLDAPANYGKVAFYADGAHGECDFSYASHDCVGGRKVNASAGAKRFFNTLPEVKDFDSTMDDPADKPRRVYRASWKTVRQSWNMTLAQLANDGMRHPSGFYLSEATE